MEKLYFDMDGVLVDWDRSVKEMGLTFSTYEETFVWMKEKIDAGDFFNVMHTSPFIDDMLTVMEEVQTLFGRNSIGILSSLGGCEGRTMTRAMDQKYDWLTQHVKPFVTLRDENILFVQHAGLKKNYADKNVFLIDDQQKNIDSFVWEGKNQGIIYNIENHEEDMSSIYSTIYRFTK